MTIAKEPPMGAIRQMDGTWVKGWVRDIADDGEKTAAQYAVAMALMSHASGCTAFVSIERLAYTSGCSPAVVKRALAWLADRGFIRIEKAPSPKYGRYTLLRRKKPLTAPAEQRAAARRTTTTKEEAR